MLQKALEESKREMEAKGGVCNMGLWNIAVGVMLYNQFKEAFINQESKTNQTTN